MPGPAIDLFSSCATVLHAGRVRASVAFLSIFLLYHTNFDIRNSGRNSAIPGFTVSHLQYKYSYMPNHKLHHASIFGTVLAKCLLVSLNRIMSQNVRVENKKGTDLYRTTKPGGLILSEGVSTILKSCYMDSSTSLRCSYRRPHQQDPSRLL